MKDEAWRAFCAAREEFRALCASLAETTVGLEQAEQRLIDGRGRPAYQVRRAVVYNDALDEVTEADTVKLILVGDNPGRREQETGRYLVGPSGKIAETFFRTILNINFRKEVVILNKTPVHTPRTVCLRELGGVNTRIAGALVESQKRMAALLAGFYKALKTPVWITGYSEMKKNGVFAAYTHEITTLMSERVIDPARLLLFRHFSMNQFIIDFKTRRVSGEDADVALSRIGAAYRERILGA